MRQFVLGLLTMLVFAAAAAAQPTAFTYQGQLKNGAQPASGPHDLRFRVFDAPSGGTQLGATLCANNVPVVGGTFSVQLDIGPRFAVPAPRFLEILVRADIGQPCTDDFGYVLLTPRQPLTAAPLASVAYALSAPDGSPAGAVVVDNDGRVGIGTATPQASLQVVANQAGPTPGEGVRITGTGTNLSNQAYLSVANSGGTALGYVGDGGTSDNHMTLASYVGSVVLSTPGGALQVGANGNVGIGTAAPAVPMQIARDADPVLVLQDTGPASTQSGYLGFWNNASAETGWMGFGTPGSPHLSVFNARSGGNIDLRPGPGGRVTIGPLFAAAGEENLRIVRGIVRDDGVILEGTGFTVNHFDLGEYAITFTTPFSDRPVVTGSPQSATGIDQVFFLNLTNGSVQIATQGNNADADGTFSFIAIGPR